MYGVSIPTKMKDLDHVKYGRDWEPTTHGKRATECNVGLDKPITKEDLRNVEEIDNNRELMMNGMVLWRDYEGMHDLHEICMKIYFERVADKCHTACKSIVRARGDLRQFLKVCKKRGFTADSWGKLPVRTISFSDHMFTESNQKNYIEKIKHIPTYSVKPIKNEKDRYKQETSRTILLKTRRRFDDGRGELRPKEKRKFGNEIDYDEFQLNKIAHGSIFGESPCFEIDYEGIDKLIHSLVNERCGMFEKLMKYGLKGNGNVFGRKIDWIKLFKKDFNQLWVDICDALHLCQRRVVRYGRDYVGAVLLSPECYNADKFKEWKQNPTYVIVFNCIINSLI